MRRNSFITTVLTAAVMTLVGMFLAPAPVSANTATSSWIQPGYNGARNEANLTENTLTMGNVRSVGLRRTYTGSATSSRNECSFLGNRATNSVVSGGYLYTSINEVVARTNLKTGVTSWRRDPLPAFSGGHVDGLNIELAVSGGLVIVTMLDCESQSDPNGFVFALNSNSGATVWTASSDPAAIHISVSGSFLVLSGGSDTSGYDIVAYRLTTGVLLWQNSYDVPCSDTVTNAIIEGGKVISCTNQQDGGPNTIEADTLATGSVAWSLTVDATTVIRGDTDAVATGHQLYLDGPSGIIDVNPKTGATKFTMAGATSIDAVSSTMVFGTCGSNLCAFNIAFGSPAWSVPNPSSGNISAWADGLLYMSDGSTINDTNGAVLTRTRISGVVVVGDGYVVVGGSGSRVVDIYGLPGS